MMARQYTSPENTERDREDYLAAIDNIVYGEDPSEGFVRGRRFLHPKLGFTFTTPENFTLDTTAQAVSGVREGGAQIGANFHHAGIELDQLLVLADGGLVVTALLRLDRFAEDLLGRGRLGRQREEAEEQREGSGGAHGEHESATAAMARLALR